MCIWVNMAVIYPRLTAVIPPHILPAVILNSNIIVDCLLYVYHFNDYEILRTRIQIIF